MWDRIVEGAPHGTIFHTWKEKWPSYNRKNGALRWRRIKL